jgi:DNA-binding response OmpR family regulator
MQSCSVTELISNNRHVGEGSFMRIMVVEDDSIVAEAITYILGDAGYEVIGPFSRTKDALAAVTAQKPDLALVDIRLEGARSGAECAKLLFRHHGIPTLYLTADPDRAHRGKSFALGCVEKPVKASDLLDSICAVTDILVGKWPKRMPRHFNMYATIVSSPPSLTQ